MMRLRQTPYQYIIPRDEHQVDEENHVSTAVATGSFSSGVLEIESDPCYVDSDEESNKNDTEVHHHGITSTNNTTGSNSVVIQRARGLIFVSSFVSQFTDGAWQFVIVVVLAKISNNRSILLVSSFSLASYVTVVLFGAPFGRFIDLTKRRNVALLCIVTKHVSVLLATVGCFWLLTTTEQRNKDDKEKGMQSTPAIPHDKQSILVIVLVHVFGSLGFLLKKVFEVAVERDWIVVLSQQQSTTDQEAWLSLANVTLRQIFLVCNVLSPLLAAWMLTVGDTKGQSRLCDLCHATILIGLLSITSLLVESVCMVKACSLVPSLALPRQSAAMTNMTPLPIVDLDDEDGDHSDAFQRQTQQGQDGDWYDEPVSIMDQPKEAESVQRSFEIYWQQPIVWAGLSLSLLYSNALSFGGAMTTFLLWEGMSVEQVGMWRSLGSAMGLAGTLAYNLSTRYTTVVNTGAWGVIYLFCCVTIACSSFLVRDHQTSIYMMVVSALVSRIGLWVFDISVTLLYQEMVPNGERGRVGGTQQSINSFFTVASGCLGLVLNKPEQFWVIATLGNACIGIATILYMVGVWLRRPKSP